MTEEQENQKQKSEEENQPAVPKPVEKPVSLPKSTETKQTETSKIKQTETVKTKHSEIKKTIQPEPAIAIHSDTAPVKPTAAPVKKKSKFFSKLVLYLTIFLLFLVVMFAFTQTSLFRYIAKGFILDYVNGSLEDKQSFFSFGRLEGNLFSEIEFTNVTLHVKNDEMLYCSSVKVNYNIFKLLGKRVEISEAILQDPQINLVKVVNERGDSVWNFAYLFEPKEEVPEEKKEFEWTINAERLRISGMEFLMLGVRKKNIPVSIMKLDTVTLFDPAYLQLQALNLETGLYYDKNSIQLKLAHLGFGTNFGFELKDLSGQYYISKSRAEINNLNLETGRSWVQAEYIFIDKLDIMDLTGLESFKNKDVRVNLIAKNFDFKDLKAFLDQVNFMNGDVYTELRVKGKFNDMMIEKLRLKTLNSQFNIAGKMLNLTEPDKLYFDIASNNFTLDPSDTRNYLPGLQVPDYSYLGKVSGDITYRGEPLNFRTTFDVLSPAGNAKGTLNMNLSLPVITYKTFLETRNINIGKIIRDNTLESNLNGKFDIEGSGTTLANLNVKINYELAGSEIYKQVINKSAGRLEFRNYNVDCDLAYISGSFKAQVKGTVNIADLNNPKYSLKGEVENLDISHFTKNIEDKSDLTFSFDVNGSGYAIQNLNGRYDLQLLNSYYGSYNIPSTPVNLEIHPGRLAINSGIFDFEAEGKYNIEKVITVINSNVQHLLTEASQKLKLDTLLPQEFKSFDKTPLEISYRFKTKDASAIRKLLAVNGFSFDADVTGTISNSEKGFNSTSIVNVKNFSFSDSLLILKDISATIVFSDDYRQYKEEQYGDFSGISLNTDIYGKEVRIGNSVYSSSAVLFNIQDEVNTFHISTRQDTTLSLILAGYTDVIEQKDVIFGIDSLKLVLNSLEIYNKEPIRVTYYPYDAESKISFENFNLSSNLLKLNLNGELAVQGSSDLNLELKDINLPLLYDYLTQPYSSVATSQKRVSSYPLKGNVRRISVNYRGDYLNPVCSFVMNTGMLRYENQKIGYINAFIDYKEDVLNTEVILLNAQGKGSLKFTGGIPFINPLSIHDSLSYASIMQKQLKMNLSAKDFQLNFFSKLLPNFAEIRGFLNGELHSSGTLEQPVLGGGMTIDKGRFKFDMNDMYFRFESKFRAENTDVTIEKFEVRNIEDNGRHLDLWGKIGLSRNGIEYLDFTTSGDIVVLENNSRQTAFGFYGDMVAGVGTIPITITGNLDNLLVKGQLVVKSANLVFPSLQGFAYDIYADDFTYKIITDTLTNTYLDTVIVVSGDEMNEVDPFLRYKTLLSQRQSSFMEKVTFDLDIQTLKNIYVSIIFNDLTREELFGELRGNLTLDNKTNKQFQFNGTIDIVGDSYYRYYKNFKVNNSQLVFRGSPTNPELNINAVYTNSRTILDENGHPYTELMDIILNISGTREKPTLTLKLRDEHGAEYTGADAQSNALAYLIFGMPITSISATNRNDILKNLGKQTGSNILSSLIQSAIREVAPFILNTELIYSEGSFATGTDIRITSAFGDAIVKFGGKIFSSIDNAEVSVEYPLAKLLGWDVSRNLIIEISRTVDNTTITDVRSVSTGIKLTWKINY